MSVLPKPNAVLELGMGWFAEEPGGLNRMYAGLFNGLLDCAVPVRGFVAGDPALAGPVPPNLTFFERRNAGFAKRLIACRRVVKAALQVQKADVVAAHFAPYALPVLDLLRRQPFVFHFHGPWAQESQAERQGGAGVAVKRTIESLVYRQVDRFIVLSQSFANVLSGTHGIAADRIHIVPGGADVGRFAIDRSRREARQVLGIPTDRPVIVGVRRLVHRVGLENLIDAMVAVRARIPEALLLIAGRGSLAQPLSARVLSLGLQDHVRLLGFVGDDDLPMLYRAADVSIVPSVALEGFGLTTIESLAAGTPVLVTPVGGLPETVQGLDANLVLPHAGVSAIAEGLCKALVAEGSLPSRERCMQYARTHFDWPVIAKRTATIYEYAITCRSAAP